MPAKNQRSYGKKKPTKKMPMRALPKKKTTKKAMPKKKGYGR
jgi:hypothetical protein